MKIELSSQIPTNQTRISCAKAADLCRQAAKLLPVEHAVEMKAYAGVCKRCTEELDGGSRMLVMSCARGCEAASALCTTPALREVATACHLAAAACFVAAGCLDY